MAPTYKNFKRVLEPPAKRKTATHQESHRTGRGATSTRIDHLELDEEQKAAQRREKMRKARDFSGLKNNTTSDPIQTKKQQQIDGPTATTTNVEETKKPKIFNVMKVRHRTTALGMQSLQLITRKGKPPTPPKPSPPAGQQRRNSANKSDNSPGGRYPLDRRNNINKNTTNSRTPPSKRKSPGDNAANDQDTRKKLNFRGAFYGADQPPAALYKRRSMFGSDSEEEEDSLLSDFIDDADLEDDAAKSPGSDDNNWRGALKEALRGYDPALYAAVDELPDRRMEATFEQIDNEEVEAAKIARAIDRREAILEAQRRRQEELEDRREEEAARKERELIKEKGYKTVAAFINDDDD